MSTIQNELLHYEKEFFSQLELVTTKEQLEQFRIKHLSRQGLLSALMAKLTALPLEQKRTEGPTFNALKERAQTAFKEKEQRLELDALEALNAKNRYFDVTAYTPFRQSGSLHPYTYAIQRAEDIFISMGFEIADGPEVDSDFYNFGALNIPPDHPARDMQDTFWLTTPELLLRTHTSSVGIHVAQKKKPPFAVVVPGRAYRNEATDASHDFMFYQLEGLYINEKASLAELFYVIKNFLQEFFEKNDLSIRIRPSYFPFVEPGVEIDMSCPFCTTGCSVCKRTRWIEICGAGLTHPNVLKAVDLEEYQGFAFGMGLTRLVMLKYGIPDIRLLNGNKIEFLKQFERKK